MLKDENSSTINDNICYKYPANIEEKEFLRQVYTTLSLDSNTPLDILDSKFSTVKTQDIECLGIVGNVKVNYSCEVGIDRKEEYLDEETYTENGQKKTRLVKKTRTVTDWSPFSGTRDSKEVVFVENKVTDYSRAYDVNYGAKAVIKSTDENYAQVLEDVSYPINSSAIATAQKLMCNQCYNGAKLPGDHQRKEQNSGVVDITSTGQYIFPEHSVTFNYRGRDYNASAFACGKLKVHCPNKPSEADDINKIVSKKATKVMLAFLLSGVGAFLLGLIITFACAINEADGGARFGMILIVLGVISGIVGMIIKTPIANKFKEKLDNNRSNIKRDALQKFLAANGLNENSSNESHNVKN